MGERQQTDDTHVIWGLDEEEVNNSAHQTNPPNTNVIENPFQAVDINTPNTGAGASSSTTTTNNISISTSMPTVSEGDNGTDAFPASFSSDQMTKDEKNSNRR